MEYCRKQAIPDMLMFQLILICWELFIEIFAQDQFTFCLLGMIQSLKWVKPSSPKQSCQYESPI